MPPSGGRGDGDPREPNDSLQRRLRSLDRGPVAISGRLERALERQAHVADVVTRSFRGFLRHR